MSAERISQTGGWFTGDLLRSCSEEITVLLDAKGRILIPSFLRKNFGLREGSKVKLKFNLKYDRVIVLFEKVVLFGDIPVSAENGQSGVIRSTKVCGALSPGAKPDGATPGSGPEKSRGDGYG